MTQHNLYVLHALNVICHGQSGGVRDGWTGKTELCKEREVKKKFKKTNNRQKKIQIKRFVAYNLTICRPRV